MCSTSKVLYKKNVVKRLGGPSQYDLILLGFTESLQQDALLSELYGNIPFNSLYAMQKEMLNLALMEMSMELRDNVHSRVVLYHYRPFSRGLNATHFSHIKKLFHDALLHAWAEPDVIDDILASFEVLRKDLFGGGNGFTNIVEELNPESNLRMARATSHLHCSKRCI